MRLAGLNLTHDCMLELVGGLRRAELNHQADTLEGALTSGQPEVSLTIPDRVAALTVLEDPPEGLAQLREVLLSERKWRRARDWDEAIQVLTDGVFGSAAVGIRLAASFGDAT